jgi:ketosteroid isomerase-like protein
MSDMPQTAHIEALGDQLRRSMEGEAWHGPSVREALAGISAADAARHPIPGAHGCWELVLHLCGSYRLVLRRLEGVSAPFLPDEDWPAVPPATEENWQRDVASLHALNVRLRSAVRSFPPDRLFEPIVADPPYPAFTQFVGLTQHDLYHAGQIVLLKRALKSQRPSESLRACETALREAQLASDAEALERLIDDALVFTGPDGGVYGKADDLEAHRRGIIRITRLDPSEEQIQEFGDLAVVTVRMEMAGTFHGQLFGGPYRYTRMWRAGPEGWRIVAGHVSAVSVTPTE